MNALAYLVIVIVLHMPDITATFKMIISEQITEQRKNVLCS